MPTRRRHDRLEDAIESALAPGTFIGYRDVQHFEEGLDQVRTKIAALIDGRDAARAVDLFETFIAACYEKLEEIDDSGGSFGTVIRELFCNWIQARQAAGADPEATARKLLSWMERDNHGYSEGLEPDAVRVLDRAGRGALERVARERLAEAGQRKPASYLAVVILKAIHVRRSDIDAYVTLCETTSGLDAADCQALAEVCVKRRRSEEALAWVERGLGKNDTRKPSGLADWELRTLQRDLLRKLGRVEDAVAAVWADFRSGPSIYSYEDLMKYVPRGERAAWHTKALEVMDGTSLSTRIDFFVKTRELDQLASAVERASRKTLMGLSHYTTEPAALKLAKRQPRLAAKLRVALGLRILESRKSKYYAAALVHFAIARKILLHEGQEVSWLELVAEIRDKHHRKSGFMPSFESLVQGRTTRTRSEPSFLDRARRRWARASEVDPE